MDDQFAYVPAAFAPAYFGTALTDQRTGGNRHYSVPNTHTNCMWPEGQLTCRVLAAGARLELLRVSTRLDKFTNWGKCPPVRPNVPFRPRESFALRRQTRVCVFLPQGQVSHGRTPAWLEATRGPMTPSHICHPAGGMVAEAARIERQETKGAPNWGNLGNCARAG